MKKRIAADALIQKLNAKISSKLEINRTLILGVVLKGLPVAYSTARTNHVIENLIPVVAHRPLQLQHHVNSYLPSLEWKLYLQKKLDSCENLLIVDDVVNSGFTKHKLESIAHLLTGECGISRWFAALVLNRKNLASSGFVYPNDIFALRVSAKEIECDWGTITVPLWDLPIEKAYERCEEYFQKHWLDEKRFITIVY